MAVRKRNEYLDSQSSDEDESGYESSAHEERKGNNKNNHSIERESKRRRLDVHDDDVPDTDESENEAMNEKSSPRETEHSESEMQKALDAQLHLQVHQSMSSLPQTDDEAEKTESTVPSDAAKKPYLRAAKKAHKTGVLYISRVPPFMKPSTLRTLLAPYGTITRLFLTPEPSASYQARRHQGGNKKRSYVDGWIEFARKRDAKACAELLNTQIIGGRKGGWYHDDVWNLRYLKGFKWSDLMEQVRVEDAERAARMRAEIGRVGRENKEFVANVERSKMLKGMERKRTEKAARNGIVDGDVERAAEPRRHFKQNEVRSKNASTNDENRSELKNVLSKIF